MGAPSLRANGSRERAPDDRLREAIQRSKQSKNWICFEAHAPRDDGIVTASCADLMTRIPRHP
jgi:hypothetical protein